MAAQPIHQDTPALEVNRDTEGLQVDYSGLQPDPPKASDSHNYLHALEENKEKHVGHDKTKPTPSERAVQRQKRARICWVRRRLFFILSILCILAIACIGAGVGGYYATQNKPPQPKADPDSDPTPTAPAVTTGVTGFAERPCEAANVSPPSAPQATPRNIANPYVTTGATFNITCRRLPDYGAGVPGLQNIAQFIEYNFTACMERCANDLDCGGVVYGANLTAMVADGVPGANCLLKNSTFVPSRVGKFWQVSAVRV